ncbi:MAG: phage/plasmid primase, P4 family [Oscillospiraceae bacterium]
MNQKELESFIKEAKQHGIYSQSEYAAMASQIKPEKRLPKNTPNTRQKSLPTLRVEDFLNESNRMNNTKFQQAIENNVKKTKVSLPDKYDSYKCIEYILENNVNVARLDNDIIIYNSQNGTWYYLHSKEGRWIFNECLPRKIIEKYDLNKIQKLYDSIEVFPDIERKSMTSDSNRKYLLNFLDGVYNCRTGEVYPHSPDYMFFYCIQANATEIKDDYDSPLLNEYIKNSLQNDEVKITTLQEIMGVALSTIRDQKISFFLLGKSNSGKSVMLNVLEMLLNGFVSTLSFSQLNNRFEPALLLGKWLNVSGEIPDLTDNRIQTFKNIVGNDSITVAYKGKDGFTLKNHALLIFGANEMPSISKPDQAYFNRIRILSYDVSVPQELWIDHLAERLYTEEIGYILRFAIDGLINFISNGMRLTYNNVSDDLVEKYKHSCNSFSDFANNCIIYSPGNKLKSKDIRSTYETFCSRNGLKPLAANVCSALLKDIYDTESTTVGKAGDKGYTNLALIDNVFMED